MSTAVTAGLAPGFKEWAAVVDALLEGEQIVDVRKGGIREDGRHFTLQHARCYLCPTTEHQRADLLKPAYARWAERTDGAVTPESTSVRIAGWVDVVGVATVDDEHALDALDGKVIWSRAYVESRFRWKRRDPLWVLALRAHRLRDPVEVPWGDAQRGCASWVALGGLPADPAELPSEPALSDVAFDARRKGLADALPGGLETPEVR